jgi:quinol-cytochrome oxidoreductase complex cytochrome b subunit
VPWLDTSPVRSARFRPIYKWVFWLLPIALIALGVVGANPVVEPFITIGQIATAYYYFHFVILLPLLGKIERPLPLPISIAAAVLSPAPSVAGSAPAERR